MKVLAQLTLLLLLFLPYFAKTALYVDIRENTVSNISLIVSKCACKAGLESELSESITKTIGTNLSDCGLFNVKRGTEAEITSYKPRSDTLSIVSLSEVSDRALELLLHLSDAFTRRELFTHSVVFRQKIGEKLPILFQM